MVPRKDVMDAGLAIGGRRTLVEHEGLPVRGCACACAEQPLAPPRCASRPSSSSVGDWLRPRRKLRHAAGFSSSRVSRRVRRGSARLGHGDDRREVGRLQRVGQALVGDDREAEHPHASVHRDDHLRHGGHAYHVGAHRAQHPVLGAGLQIGTGHRHVDAFAQRDAQLQGQFPRVRPASAASYGADMSGKRGPNRSSWGPMSGLSPSRLMWSERRTRSPGPQSGCMPPQAFETIERLGAQRAHDAHREGDLLQRVAFVAMKASLHGDHRLAGGAVPRIRRPACDSTV